MIESEEKLKLNIAQLKKYFRFCVSACDEILTNDDFDAHTVKRIMNLCLQRINNAKDFITKNCFLSNICGERNDSSHLLLSQSDVKQEPKTIGKPLSHDEYKDRVISNGRHILTSRIRQANDSGPQSPDLFMSDSSVPSNYNGTSQLNGIEGKDKSSRDEENVNGEVTVLHPVEKETSPVNSANIDPEDNESLSNNVKSKKSMSQCIKSKETIDTDTSSDTSLDSEDKVLSLTKSKMAVLSNDDKKSQASSVDSQATALPSSYDDNEDTNDIDSNATVIDSVPKEWCKVKVQLNRIPFSSLNSSKTNSKCGEDMSVTETLTFNDKENGDPDSCNDSIDVRNSRVALWNDSHSHDEDSDHVRNEVFGNQDKATPGKAVANSSSLSSSEDESLINQGYPLKRASVLRSDSSSSSLETGNLINRKSPLKERSLSSSETLSEISSISEVDSSDIESSSSSSSLHVAKTSKKKKQKNAKLTKKNVVRDAPLSKRKFFEDSDNSEDIESSESDVSADDEEISAALKFDMMKRERLMKQRAETKELLNRLKDSDEEQCVTFQTSVLKLTRVDDLIELTDDESIVLWPTIPKTVWHQLGHNKISRDVKFQELKDVDYASSDSYPSSNSVERLTQMVKFNKRVVPRKRKKTTAAGDKKKRRRLVRSDSDAASDGKISPVSSEYSNHSFSERSEMDDTDDEEMESSDEGDEDEATKRLLMEDSDNEEEQQRGVGNHLPKIKKAKITKEADDNKKENKAVMKDRVILSVPKIPSLESNRKRKKRRAAKVGEVKRRTCGRVMAIPLPSSDDSSDYESLNSSNYSSSVEELYSDGDFQSSSMKNTKKQKLSILSDSKSESKSGSSGSMSDDSDVNITRVERIPSSQRRKNIRGIIRQQDLSFNTIHADMEQRNRKKRYKDLQSQYNQYLVQDKKEGGKLEKVILQEHPLIQVEPSLARCLREHQAKAMQLLWFNLVESVDRVKNGDPGSGAMVAHYMGLGKTLTTIALIHTIFMHDELLNIRRFLIIVPKNVLENWSKEWKKWMSIADQRCPRIFTVHRDTPQDRPRIIDRWHRRGGLLILSYNIMTIAFTAVYPELRKKPPKKQLEKEDIETLKRCLIDPGPDLVVCDEAHVMKNDNTILFQGMSMIKTKRRAILTGTPMQNHLIEYHTMVSFIKPNYLGTQKEFKNRFANPISNGQKADSSKADVKVMKKRTYILNRKLDSIMDRKDDSYLLNDIPPKLQYVINVRLSDAQAELYRTYLRHIGMEGIDALSTDQMNQLMLQENMHRTILQHRYIFQYICCHPTLLKWQQKIHASKNQMTTEVASQQTEQEKQACEQALSELARAEWWVHLYEEERAMDPSVSNKLLLLFLIIDACSDIGDKVVVFSNSVLALELIERMLKRSNQWPFTRRCTQYSDRWEKGRDFLVLTGKTASQDRQDMADRFNNTNNHRLRLFLISIKAGGVGMNLYGANRVIILDPSWNPADENQACGRAYRLGQKKRTYIYRLVGAGTAEEQLYKRQVDKQTLSLRVVDEQQTDRHYTQHELSAFYIFTHTEVPSEPDWAPPQDRLLADVMVAASHCITGYHLHENMLLNRNEEKLTEEEYADAWKEYEEETKRQQLFEKQDEKILGSMHSVIDSINEHALPSAAMNFIKKSIPQSRKELSRLLKETNKSHVTKSNAASGNVIIENLQGIGHTSANVGNPTISGVGSIGSIFSNFGAGRSGISAPVGVPGSGLGLFGSSGPSFDLFGTTNGIFPRTSRDLSMPMNLSLPSSSLVSDSQNANSSLFSNLSDIGHVNTASVSTTGGKDLSLSDVQIRQQYPEKYKEFRHRANVVHFRLTQSQQEEVATRQLREYLRTS